MSDYVEPTQEQFNEAETVARDTITTTCPTAMTKTGSVIHELIIRPLSYLYAWSKANLDELCRKTSVAYLKTSTLTENTTADAVASNYFVTRNSGTTSSGIITVTCSQPTATIQKGSAFYVNSTKMVTSSLCVLSTGVASNKQDNVTYITVLRTLDSAGGIHYLANIPVVSETSGQIEIVCGASVEVGFPNTFIESAELTSPITGGSNTETDSELMARCEINTAASGIGSYNGLRKKLNGCAYPVLGMSVVAGDDKPLFRARYNNTNVNPGGFVDVHVKTQKQASTGSVLIDLTSSTVTKTTGTGNSTVYTFDVVSDEYAGFFAVSRIVGSKCGTVETYSVSFGTTDPIMDADGARLSCKQKATVSFSSLYDDETAAYVYLDYIPYLEKIQEFMDSADNAFIGQDVCVKAAVPVYVSVQCCVSCPVQLEDSEIALIKETIADYINSLSVGIGCINFSDFRAKCANALSKADLRIPCSMSAKMYLKDGTRDIITSDTGVLDITSPVSNAYWPSSVCFFCTTTDGIRLEQV